MKFTAIRGKADRAVDLYPSGFTVSLHQQRFREQKMGLWVTPIDGEGLAKPSLSDVRPSIFERENAEIVNCAAMPGVEAQSSEIKNSGCRRVVLREFQVAEREVGLGIIRHVGAGNLKLALRQHKIARFKCLPAAIVGI